MKIRCKKCDKDVVPILTHRIIPVPTEVRGSDKRIPKYTIMVKASCIECRSYIKFIEQTDEVIDTINGYLDITQKSLTD